MRSFGSIPFQSPSGQAPQSMAEQCPGPYLEILRGRTDFPLRPLELERFLIGAGSQCTLQLGGEGMPILHSLITRTAGGYQIEALASFPMLRINGQPARSGALTDGDLVMIGAFEFGIRLPALSTANAEPSNQLLDVEAILREADREARSIPDMSVEELLAGLEDFTQQFDARDAQRRQGETALVQAILASDQTTEHDQVWSSEMSEWSRQMEERLRKMSIRDFGKVLEEQTGDPPKFLRVSA